MAVGKAEKGRLRYLRATVTGLSRVQRTRLVAHRADRRPSRRAQPTRPAPRRQYRHRAPRRTRQAPRHRVRTGHAPALPARLPTFRRPPPTRAAAPRPSRRARCRWRSARAAARRRVGYRDADIMTLDKQRTSLPRAADDLTRGPPSTSSPPSPALCATRTPRVAVETARRRRCRSMDPAA